MRLIHGRQLGRAQELAPGEQRDGVAVLHQVQRQFAGDESRADDDDRLAGFRPLPSSTSSALTTLSPSAPGNASVLGVLPSATNTVCGVRESSSALSARVYSGARPRPDAQAWRHTRQQDHDPPA
ncbi:MAG: hypothetical protein ACLSHG_12380 [Oscillospiraceae bacterium]